LRKTALLNVVGTFYNRAKEAYTDHELSDNAPIKLVAEVENQHDKNAVAVFSNNHKYKLGHINKKLAPKYQKLVLENRIISCAVFEATTVSNSIKLQISVTYEDDTKQATNPAIISAPTKSGVYKIQLGTSRLYIGSTTNFKKRWASHLNDLRASHHSNGPMQSDFNNFSEANLTFDVILYCSNDQIEIKEEQAIQSALKQNKALYNMTKDGRGYIGNVTSNNTSISDRQRQHITNQAEHILEGNLTDLMKSEIDGTKTDEKIEAFKVRLEKFLNENSSAKSKEHSSIEQALKETFFNRFKTATINNPGYDGKSFLFRKFGFGREFFKNGDCYAGEHKKNKRHSHGTFRWASGDKYAGNWIEGERTGLGSYTWQNGNLYEGQWENGKMHGYGFFVSNSEKYWGTWSYGKLEKKAI
jgi:group I intron endonuclease